MSEQIENTQPQKPFDVDDTQPIKPIKKKSSRWRSIFVSVLGFLLLVGMGAFGGYSSGIGDRLKAEVSVTSKQLTEQYTLALVDITFGRYATAQERLEYIIKKDPSFPGAQEKLTEVLVASNMHIPTNTPTPTPTSTPDFSGAESAFKRAQQLIQAQDWPNALGALDTIRKLDPTYKTAQVDGMYYYVLRNHGHNLITKEGNLEGGIYYLTLAERFGPLDNSSKGIREGARAYIRGASYWELDWKQAVEIFAQVGTGFPSLWDGTMTASQRFYQASMRYGDELFARSDYCGAYLNYTNAMALGGLDKTSAKNYNNAFTSCYPATPTLEIIATNTTGVLPTEPPVGTEVPTVPPSP
jgi:tetratricopeptide (TPR) repeat protein